MRLVERFIDLDPLVMSRSRVDRSTDKEAKRKQKEMIRRARWANDPVYRERELERGRKWRREHPESHAKSQRKWRAKNIEYYRAAQQVRSREYRKKKPELLRRLCTNYRKRLRVLVINHYGGICVCCGEVEMGFLTIHHINNDGAEHRREVGRAAVYQWLKNNGFPEGYEVRCYNCNCGMEYNGGVCPHENSRTTN